MSKSAKILNPKRCDYQANCPKSIKVKCIDCEFFYKELKGGK